MVRPKITDRYHATAVDTGGHLFQCLIYIDMNMVRAGVVKHPHDWATCGYHEIHSPKDRYGIIDHDSLAKLLRFHSVSELPKKHRQWIDEALHENAPAREANWSQSIAVGSQSFVNRFVETVN